MCSPPADLARAPDGVVPVAALTPFTPDPAPLVGDEAAPAAPQPVATVGVVTYNVNRGNVRETFLADAERLATDPDVDLVGWQEAFTHRPWLARLREHGWETAWFEPGAKELPVSWRADAFELLDAAQHQMHDAWMGKRRRRPPRFVVRVCLRHRATGHRLTFLNTHVTSRIEDRDHPGHWGHGRGVGPARRHLAQLAAMWDGVPGRYVVAAADLNFDHVHEARVRPAGGPSDAFAGRAVSSWEALGTDGVPGTSVVAKTRQPVIYDYVYVAARTLAAGRAAFAGHWVLDGFHSDHRPVLARVHLY